ncbi:MAG: hypothetical protein ACRDLB_07490, partial [Actinomycetota bacterium]
MRLRSVVAAVIMLTAFTACRSEKLDLAYALDEGTTLEYTMTADAEAQWNIGDDTGSGSYRASFDVTETVRSVESDGAVVHVEMHPTTIEEDGLPSPGPEERSFTLRIGHNGQV